MKIVPKVYTSEFCFIMGSNEFRFVFYQNIVLVMLIELLTQNSLWKVFKIQKTTHFLLLSRGESEDPEPEYHRAELRSDSTKDRL